MVERPPWIFPTYIDPWVGRPRPGIRHCAKIWAESGFRTIRSENPNKARRQRAPNLCGVNITRLRLAILGNEGVLERFSPCRKATSNIMTRTSSACGVHRCRQIILVQRLENASAVPFTSLTLCQAHHVGLSDGVGSSQTRMLALNGGRNALYLSYDKPFQGPRL